MEKIPGEESGVVQLDSTLLDLAIEFRLVVTPAVASIDFIIKFLLEVFIFLIAHNWKSLYLNHQYPKNYNRITPKRVMILPRSLKPFKLIKSIR